MPYCGSENMPAVNFDFCTPKISQSEIRRVFISLVGSEDFTDWSSPGEWLTRLSNNSTSINAIRSFWVIGDKPTASLTKVRISNDRSKVVRREHTINATIDDVSDANHAFVVAIRSGRMFRVWYETMGGYIFGGNGGIVCHVSIDMILNRGLGEIATYQMTATWNNLATEDRAISPIFDIVDGDGCGEVTGLAVSDITGSSLTFSWDNESGQVFEYAYNTTGEAPDFYDEILGGEVTLTGLTEGTVYYFFVRRVCSSIVFSELATLATATLPALFLFRAGRDDDGDFKRYAIVRLGLLIDGVPAYAPLNLFYSEIDESDYLDYLNDVFGVAQSLTGTFSVSVSGDFYYVRGLGEDVELAETVQVCRHSLMLTVNTTIGGDLLFKMRAFPNALQFIDWRDGSSVVLNTYPTGSGVITFSHTYATEVGSKDMCIFYNNKMGYSFYSGAVNMIQDVQGDIPTPLNSFSIFSITSFNAVSDLSVNNNTGALETFSVTYCGALESFSGDFFLKPMPNIKRVNFSNNSLTSTTCDMLVNTFVANAWDGLSGGAGYYFRCASQTGGGTYTAASLVARNALIAKGWVVS